MAAYTLAAFADEASSLFYEQIRAMSENGVHYLEMRGVNGRNVADMTPDEVRCAAHMLDCHNLAVSSIGSPIGKIKITDPFEPHLEKFKRILEAARITGAKWIRLFSFFGVDSPEKESEALSRLDKMAGIAAGSGVILCHENEKGIFGWNAENCRTILTSIPGIRGVFDPANFVQCGVDTAKAWEILAPYTDYLHIKDALPDGRVVPAGHGTGNLAMIMKDFSDRGGQVYSLEPHLSVFKGFSDLEGDSKTPAGNFAYPDSMAAFRASADAAKAILDRFAVPAKF